MSSISFDYYYLSGKDIPLKKYNLGVIRQLTLNNFIDYEMDINEFIQPFILNKNIMLNKNDNIDKFLQDVKDLSFLFLYEQLTNYSIISNLLKSLSMIYQTKNVYVDKENIAITVIDKSNTNKYIINDDNFSILSTIVCEMMGVDRSKVEKIEPKKEMSDIEKEFERRRQKYQQLQQQNKVDKSNEYTILDIANIVVHFSGLTYGQVFDMTIYQLKNSFKVLALEKFCTNCTCVLDEKSVNDSGAKCADKCKNSIECGCRGHLEHRNDVRDYTENVKYEEYLCCGDVTLSSRGICACLDALYADKDLSNNEKHPEAENNAENYLGSSCNIWLYTCKSLIKGTVKESTDQCGCRGEQIDNSKNDKENACVTKITLVIYHNIVSFHRVD